MRIEDLKVFVDVVRYHSMNVAAENNFTTPQNLSKIIKRMEDELGVILFKRSKKGSELTKNGEKFYIHIVQALKYYNNALIAIDCVSDEGGDEDINRISVICSVGALSEAANKAYNEILRKYEGVFFNNEEINFSSPKYLIKNFLNEKYDVIACYVPQDSINIIQNRLKDYIIVHILFDELVLVVSRNNLISRRKLISIDDIDEKNLICFKDFTLMDSLLEKKKYHQIYTNSHSKALEQIRNSDVYCTFLFESYCRMNADMFSNHGDFRMVRLDRKIFGTYLIAMHVSRLGDKCVADFISILEQQLNIVD